MHLSAATNTIRKQESDCFWKNQTLCVQASFCWLYLALVQIYHINWLFLIFVKVDCLNFLGHLRLLKIWSLLYRVV